MYLTAYEVQHELQCTFDQLMFLVQNNQLPAVKFAKGKYSFESQEVVKIKNLLETQRNDQRAKQWEFATRNRPIITIGVRE